VVHLLQRLWLIEHLVVISLTKPPINTASGTPNLVNQFVVAVLPRDLRYGVMTAAAPTVERLGTGARYDFLSPAPKLGLDRTFGMVGAISMRIFRLFQTTLT
jgi:hypothetical protein